MASVKQSMGFVNQCWTNCLCIRHTKQFWITFLSFTTPINQVLNFIPMPDLNNNSAFIPRKSMSRFIFITCVNCPSSHLLSRRFPYDPCSQDSITKVKILTCSLCLAPNCPCLFFNKKLYNVFTSLCVL